MSSTEKVKNGNHSSAGAAQKAAEVFSETTAKIDATIQDVEDRVARADGWFRAISKQRPMAILGVALFCGFVVGKIVSKLGGR